MKRNFHILSGATLAVAALAACSTVPEGNLVLEQARMRLHAAQTDPQLALHAGDELRRADSAVRRAEQAHADGQPRAEVDHLSYLGSQRVTIARETADSRAAQTVTAGAKAERDRLLLTQRTQEADAAVRDLATSQALSQRKSDELAQAERAAAAGRAQAERDAAAGRAELARSDARAESLEQQLMAIDARRTERGIVVTLGDVLFDSGQSHLQSGGAGTIAKLGAFMRSNPERRAAIEGYTDDVGGDLANQRLSDRRAEAVRMALVDVGVGAERLSARGHGERNPVAGNDTAAGRQMNRRVEIVFVPQQGDVLVGR